METFNETLLLYKRNLNNDPVILSSIAGVSSVYLIIALVFHQVKVEQPRTQRFLQLSLENKLTVLSKFTCIVVGILSLIYHWIDFGDIFFQSNVVFKHSSNMNLTIDFETLCETIYVLNLFVFAVGNGLVYLFLWFRQRVFYIHPSLKNLNSKFMKRLSTSILITFVIYLLSSGTCAMVFFKIDFSKEHGCFFSENSRPVVLLILIIWNVVSILMQIFLLGLFIYPILKQTSWRGHQSSNRRLMKRVKKAIVLTVISLSLDFVPLVGIICIYVEITNSLFSTYSLTLIVNHLVTIVCFDNWKQLLWPWKLKRSNQELNRNKNKSEDLVVKLKITPRNRCNESTVYTLDM